MTIEGEPKDKRSNRKKYDVVLTAYLDGGGDLQFHGGLTSSDFKKDIEKGYSGIRVLRRFFIKGKIVDESGLIEPISMR